MEAAVHNERRFFVYGRKTIEYRLLYRERRTMEIAVHPDSTVVVKAPVDAAIDLIEDKLRKRARWILRQMNYFRQFDPRTPVRCYVNGETHLYLGRQYRLKLAKGTENSVKLIKGSFHVTTPDATTPETAKKLLEEWYREKARLHFSESMNRCWEKFRELDVERPDVYIRKMRTKWGSLSDKGTISLNTDLIRVPKECIDYVVTHELCHAVHHNHGKAFYQLLDQLMPDWKKRKNKLEAVMA